MAQVTVYTMILLNPAIRHLNMPSSDVLAAISQLLKEKEDPRIAHFSRGTHAAEELVAAGISIAMDICKSN